MGANTRPTRPANYGLRPSVFISLCLLGRMRLVRFCALVFYISTGVARGVIGPECWIQQVRLSWTGQECCHSFDRRDVPALLSSPPSCMCYSLQRPTNIGVRRYGNSEHGSPLWQANSRGPFRTQIQRRHEYGDSNSNLSHLLSAFVLQREQCEVWNA